MMGTHLYSWIICDCIRSPIHWLPARSRSVWRSKIWLYLCLKKKIVSIVLVSFFFFFLIFFIIVCQFNVLSFAEKSRVDVYTSQSQSSLFHNFVLRANKYHALDLSGPVAKLKKQPKQVCSQNKRQTVIVVEDMPNIFFRDSEKFHDILRYVKGSGTNIKLVIIRSMLFRHML